MPGRDPAHGGRDLALPVGRQVREHVMLDVGVEAAVEDPEIGAVLEGHLFGENSLQEIVNARTANEVPGRAELARVVLVRRLVWTGVGKHLQLAGVMFDRNEEEHRHVAGHATEIVGQQCGQEGRTCPQRLAQVALPRIAHGDAHRRAQQVSAEEASAIHVPCHVAEHERRALGCRRGERPDDRGLHDVVAEPVLTSHRAGDAVAEIVIPASDVGVWVVALVVHHLPLADVDVEIPLVALGVVFAAVGQMVVAAVDDVVAQFGELEQAVEHLEDHGAAHGLRATVAQELEAPGVDRLAVSGDVSDVGQVLVTDLCLGQSVQILKIIGETLFLADGDSSRHRTPR